MKKKHVKCPHCLKTQSLNIYIDEHTHNMKTVLQNLMLIKKFENLILFCGNIL